MHKALTAIGFTTVFGCRLQHRRLHPTVYQRRLPTCQTYLFGQGGCVEDLGYSRLKDGGGE